jgi:hypothetical protein
MSRQLVQQALSGQGPMIVETALRLVHNAYVAGFLDDGLHWGLLKEIAAASPTAAHNVDYEPYVVIGNPLRQIMRALEDVPFRPDTREQVEQKVSRVLQRVLRRTSGPNASFRFEVIESGPDARLGAMLAGAVHEWDKRLAEFCDELR